MAIVIEKRGSKPPRDNSTGSKGVRLLGGNGIVIPAVKWGAEK